MWETGDPSAGSGDASDDFLDTNESLHGDSIDTAFGADDLPSNTARQDGPGLLGRLHSWLDRNVFETLGQSQNALADAARMQGDATRQGVNWALNGDIGVTTVDLPQPPPSNTMVFAGGYGMPLDVMTNPRYQRNVPPAELASGILSLASPFGPAAEEGELATVAQGIQKGLDGTESLALPRANAANVAKFLKQGFSGPQADYLAEPYVGMGHHFVPRRFDLPSSFSDSPFNVLKPSGMSRGDFYELHFKVDPRFYGTGLPRRLGGGGWSGKSLGLERYGQFGRIWNGSPTPLKLTVGGVGAVGAGSGAYWADENGN